MTAEFNFEFRMPPAAKEAILEASRQAGVLPQELLGPTRRREAVDARAAAMRALYAKGYQATQIGRWLCRYHTTVRHHVKAAAAEVRHG